MSIDPSGTPAEQLGAFYDFMWGDTEGYVYLPTKDYTLAAPADWKKAFFAWPRQKASVVEYTLSKNAEGKDVYFAPTLFRKPNAKKENALGSYVLWADYDGSATPDWQDMVSRAESGSPAAALGLPSLRIQSSSESNQHVYWRLKEFCTDIEFIESANRGIAYGTNADLSGWDANQVLRPIQTENHKYKSDNTVQLYDQGPADYVRDSFVAFKPVKEAISTSISDESIPEFTVVLGAYSWEPDDLELITKETLDARDRSSALQRVAYVGAERGLSDSEIYALLLHCDDRWQKYVGRNDRKRRLVDLINRAKLKHPHKKEELEITFAGLRSDKTETEQEPQTVFGLKDLIDLDIKIEWMIEKCIPKGGLGMLVSAPGVGKTQIALKIGQACALGVPFLRWTPIRQHKVLFFSQEMNLPHIKSVLATMAEVYNGEQMEILNRNFLITASGTPMDWTNKAVQRYVEELIETHKPEGIYVDSLQTSYPKELSKDEIRDFFAYLSRLRKKYGVYVMLIHHNRKAQEGNKKPRDLDDVYGNVIITASPDYIVNLWKKSPDATKMELRDLKVRLAETPGPIWISRAPNLQFIKVEADDGTDGPSFDGLRSGKSNPDGLAQPGSQFDFG